MDAGEVKKRHEILQALKRRKDERELQRAKLGVNTDPAILMEIEDLSKEIEELERNLRGYSQSKPQNPDNSSKRSRLISLEFIGLLAAIISCVAAVIVVPEVRQLLRLDRPTLLPATTLVAETAVSPATPLSTTFDPATPTRSDTAALPTNVSATSETKPTVVPALPSASGLSLPYRKYELTVWSGIPVRQSEANVHGILPS